MGSEHRRRRSLSLAAAIAIIAAACSGSGSNPAAKPGSVTSDDRAAEQPAGSTPTNTTTISSSPPARSAIHYSFPIRPLAGVSYGHVHHDYPATDIFAPCGAEVVAVVDGTVSEVSRTDRWDPKVNDGATRGGLSISVVGADGVRYYGSHLSEVSAGLSPGTPVRAGDPIGRVGKTGDARSTPCHLHFGISPPCGTGDWQVRRGVLYPWKVLDSWRAGGQASPSAELAALDAQRQFCSSKPAA